MHKIIEDERYEIEHHRPQEREELIELYRAKGFSGKLLEEVVDVLMADQNRLLQVMLEEELGLRLSSYEHPIKVGAGAGLGALLSSIFLLLGLWIFGSIGLYSVAFCAMGLSAVLLAKQHKNKLLQMMIWNLSAGALVTLIVYFLAKMAARV